MSTDCVTTSITTVVPERETAGFQVDFKDTDGTAVTPSSASWTLTDETGSVVNSREDVSMVVDTSVVIVLSPHASDPDGDDTALTSAEQLTGSAYRYITVVYFYNSSKLGSNARGVIEGKFKIGNTKGQT